MRPKFFKNHTFFSTKIYGIESKILIFYISPHLLPPKGAGKFVRFTKLSTWHAFSNETILINSGIFLRKLLNFPGICTKTSKYSRFAFCAPLQTVSFFQIWMKSCEIWHEHSLTISAGPIGPTFFNFNPGFAKSLKNQCSTRIDCFLKIKPWQGRKIMPRNKLRFSSLPLNIQV